MNAPTIRIINTACVRPGTSAPRFARSALLALLLCSTSIGLLTACDGDTPRDSETPPPVDLPPQQPELIFPQALQDEHPQASAFLQEFLDVCLRGDYFGYRQMVSRAYTPEPRERFEAIYQAVDLVEIEDIEQLRIPGVPEPTFRVVTRVVFDDSSRARRREDDRRIAFLVFPEQNEMRMGPAPTALQPARDEPPTTQTAPATTQPAVEYPWEEGVDE